MSVDSAGLGGPRPAVIDSPRRVARGLIARVRSAPVVAQAFVASRLVVILSGAGAMLTMTKHAPAAAVSAALHHLGPVGYVLAGPGVRFDAGYYLDIAHGGYGTLASGKVAFFPFYPAVIRLVTPVFGSPVLAGMLISAAAFAGALVALHRLTELELGRPAADTTVLLLCFAPLSFFFSAVYTESLFLLLTVTSVLAARRDRWGLACLLGALATLTRPTGLVLVVLLVAVRWRAQGGPDRRLAYVVALPGALLAYLVGLMVAGYPWMAPFHAEALWSRTTVGPLMGLASAVFQALRGAGHIAAGGSIYDPRPSGVFSSSAENLILILNLGLAVLALVWCWRRLRREYAVYAALVLMSLISSPVIGEPLASVDRYLLTTFPLWMAAGAWLAHRPRLVAPVLAVGCGLLVFYTAQVSAWSFVA